MNVRLEQQAFESLAFRRAEPDFRALIDMTQQSPVVSSEGRVKFFKLAWDAVGSEFASRHTQYEMFYAGATFVTKGHSFRTFD
jgi:4-hydroxyphenylacetate 3-monooxygenase